MRRWNGWGDDAVDFPLPDGAETFLAGRLGPVSAPSDVSLAEAVERVPPSRLPDHPLIDRRAEVRLRHARGQSLPDWIALRSGRIDGCPDGVSFPTSELQVGELLSLASRTGTRIIPFGGGTSVLGHVSPVPGEAPVLTVSLARMNALLGFDEESRVATFGAGVAGPDLEAELRARGFTLGHFPQSFEYSTLGGWIATRSSGQQSLGYGRIERLFAGGRLVAPAGALDLPPVPASAAGPDLRELVLGSEGRLGIITRASVRVRPLPERERFHAVFFPELESGIAAVRELVQAGVPLSMLRLSTPVETETMLLLAGHARLIQLLEGALRFRGAGAGKCMLLLGISGSREAVRSTRRDALAVVSRCDGVRLGGGVVGKGWQRGRFRVPYLRNTLWESGVAVDTLETATRWSNVTTLLEAVERALATALEPLGERAHVFTHFSHFYADGASLYTTCAYRIADPDATLERWRALKTAASEAIVTHGGTISHHHGVGFDHAPWLVREKGALGVAALRDVCARFDPAGLMNPGKLLPD